MRVILLAAVLSSASSFSVTGVAPRGPLSFPHSPAASPRLRQTPLLGSSSPETGNEDSAAAERRRLRTELDEALRGLERGFSASAEQRKAVEGVVSKLAAVSPVAAPARMLLKEDSAWTLLYSDAPDIVGNGNALPIAPRSGRIGQRFDAREATVTNIVEAIPPQAVADSLSQVASDSVEQRVVLRVEAKSDVTVSLSLLGLSVQPGKVLGVDVAWLPPLALQLPAPAPFGEFQILYYDGELRVVRTGQGYLGINSRDAE